MPTARSARAVLQLWSSRFREEVVAILIQVGKNEPSAHVVSSRTDRPKVGNLIVMRISALPIGYPKKLLKLSSVSAAPKWES